jgi:PPOX class probable F420-dependent enzyme
MAATLSEVARRLLEGPVMAHLATLMRDGSPQVTPVWIDFDGRFLLVNSEEHRQKVRNVRRDPRVAVSVLDTGRAYTRLLVRGRVVQVSAEGAVEHIEKLARKYTGIATTYVRRPDDRRVIIKIQPESVSLSTRWA